MKQPKQLPPWGGVPQPGGIRSHAPLKEVRFPDPPFETRRSGVLKWTVAGRVRTMTLPYAHMTTARKPHRRPDRPLCHFILTRVSALTLRPNHVGRQ